MTAHARMVLVTCFCLMASHCHGTVHADTTGEVIVRRIPGGGVQPQVQVDARRGVVHLIYLKGDPSHSDVEYVRSSDDGRTWSAPVRVNTQPGSAIAMGTVRGAHLAIGRNGRVHVAWMGSSTAEPKALGGATPMLYTRLSDDGTSFEPQRNIIVSHPGLDGGGSIAADDRGGVYIAWHAPSAQKAGEQARRVWVARSTDDGTSFAPEVPISDPATGACGCCGMRLATAGGKVYALYRGAAEQVNRGMYLITTSEDLVHAQGHEIAPMKLGICIMSTAAFAPGADGRMLAAWETKDHVFWSDLTMQSIHEPPPVLDAVKSRKHPAIASTPAGRVCLAWAEGTGWNKGGSAAWQVFDPTGQPVPGGAGRADQLPAWDAPAIFCGSSGQFILIY